MCTEHQNAHIRMRKKAVIFARNIRTGKEAARVQTDSRTDTGPKMCWRSRLAWPDLAIILHFSVVSNRQTLKKYYVMTALLTCQRHSPSSICRQQLRLHLLDVHSGRPLNRVS